MERKNYNKSIRIPKILISYYYQVRNFKSNMIPISTSCGDPGWFHDWLDKEYQFADNRGIWNGIRYEILNCSRLVSPCSCFSCDKSNPENCGFLKDYSEYLNTISWENFLQDMQKLEAWGKAVLGIESPILVLCVHEAWYNPCSEREPLKKWFKKHNYILEEFVPEGGLHGPKRK